MPPGGGFDEATALLCLHAVPGSARVFDAFLHRMALDRSIYAPDLPGHGQSDPAPAPLSVAGIATTLAEFIDSMRLRRVDVLGMEIGAIVAAELALLRPDQVRRVAMLGVPAYGSEERSSWGTSEPAPYALRERFVALKVPVLVLRPADALADSTARAREFLRTARCVDLEGSAGSMIESSPEAIADELRAFFVG